VFYEVSFVVGFSLFFVSIFFAAKTLIGLSIPILIFLFFGLIVFLIEKNHYNNVYGYDNYLYPFLHLTTSFGGIALFLFFILNFAIRLDNIKSKEYDILNRYSSFGGKGKRDILHPDFIIRYKNKDKVISFPEEFNDDIEAYKIIELKTSRGLFGFDILISKKLKK